MQIQFPSSVSSPRAGSVSTEAVTMDVVDMLLKEDQMDQFMQGRDRAQDVRLRKILQFTTDTTKA